MQIVAHTMKEVTRGRMNESKDFFLLSMIPKAYPRDDGERARFHHGEVACLPVATGKARCFLPVVRW